MIRPVVESARRMAADMFADEGTITRGGSAPVFDPVAGTLTASTGATVYSGPCRVRMPNAAEMRSLFGEEQVTKLRFVGLFPWDIAKVEIDDVLTVTESDDPYIGQRTFKVIGVPSSTVLTHRRIMLEVDE